MRWQVLLRPVGSEPLGVYWRRRFVVLAAVIVVIVVLVLTLGGSGTSKTTAGTGAHPAPAARGGATPATSAAPSTAASGSPVASPSAAAGPCLAHDLAATAALSAHTFPAGASVLVNITITNTAPTPCVLDTQPSQVSVSMQSGGIHNWANTDCGPVGVQPVPLAAGASHTVTVSWDRLRSESGCPTAVHAERADPGTYTVSVSVAGNPVTFAHLAAVFTLR
jgi:hypothetical protein